MKQPNSAARLRFAKLAPTLCVAAAFFLYGSAYSLAIPIAPSPTQATQQQVGETDWVIEVVTIIGAFAALGALALQIIDSPSLHPPPAAEADVTVQADEDGASNHAQSNTINTAATAAALAIGSLGSFAYGELSATNVGKGNGKFNSDKSHGNHAKGGSSGGTLVGKIDGIIKLQKPVIPPQDFGDVSNEMALLTFTPTLSGSDPALMASAGMLSADLSINVDTNGPDSFYDWGFTAVSQDGLLHIVDRRGSFVDSDIVISGDQITSMTPPAATFSVPVDQTADYSESVQLSAFEAPEPSGLAVMCSGLLPLLFFRRRAAVAA